MTRQEKIKSGKLWQVYPAGEPDNVLFEGYKTNCQKYIRLNCPSAWVKGYVRLGKVIYEPENLNNEKA